MPLTWVDIQMHSISLHKSSDTEAKKRSASQLYSTSVKKLPNQTLGGPVFPCIAFSIPNLIFLLSSISHKLIYYDIFLIRTIWQQKQEEMEGYFVCTTIFVAVTYFKDSHAPFSL